MLKCPFNSTRRHIVTAKGGKIRASNTLICCVKPVRLFSFPRDRDGQFSDVFFFGQVQKFVERSNQQLLL
jgi:hypothetical protein